MVYFYLKGTLIGFSIAAPVGPIGVLCIRRTLAYGRRDGFISGLGAATADAVYAATAAFSLTFVSSFLVKYQFWTRLTGGLFLLGLSIKFFFTPPADESVHADKVNYASAYVSMFALTLTNPMTIVSYAAVFAGLGLGVTGNDYDNAAATVAGVFMGSSMWWLTLSAAVDALRMRFCHQSLRVVNRTAGVVLAALAIMLLVSLRSK